MFEKFCLDDIKSRLVKTLGILVADGLLFLLFWKIGFLPQSGKPFMIEFTCVIILFAGVAFTFFYLLLGAKAGLQMIGILAFIFASFALFDAYSLFILFFAAYFKRVYDKRKAKKILLENKSELNDCGTLSDVSKALLEKQIVIVSSGKVLKKVHGMLHLQADCLIFRPIKKKEEFSGYEDRVENGAEPDLSISTRLDDISQIIIGKRFKAFTISAVSASQKIVYTCGGFYEGIDLIESLSGIRSDVVCAPGLKKEFLPKK